MRYARSHRIYRRPRALTYLHFARSVQNTQIVDRSDAVSVFLGLTYRLEPKLH